MEAKSPGQQEQATEAKVQVDRRKLEAMITGELSGESADAFFARVEKNTGAKVCWPSKLKIRAKTKKDPFVKLIGTPQSVQRAAEVIGEQLKAKKERVILKVEICHSLHSQIIGKGGRNTQQIMRDTHCHIHFPDSNKSLSNPSMAMNDQVSISGCAKGVEMAREMIRAICPLTVAVTIQLDVSRNLYSIQPRLDPTQLQRHFPLGSDLSVQFVTKGPPLLGALHFLMRSSVRNELEMLRAFGKVCQLIGVFPSGAELHFECQFELRATALPSLGAVRWIAFRTNTQIEPNPQGLLISGPLEGIFIARKLLTGLLPVSLHFEKGAELHDFCPTTSREMETELDVQIREKRRRKGAKAREGVAEEKEFVLCTYEANLFGVYTVRNRLLQIREPVKDQFPLDSESAAFMRSICRESLMADQQQTLITAAASVAFSNSAHLSFEQKEMMGGKEAKKEVGLGELNKCRERRDHPKSPDPQKSPIAAGLLAGVKNVNSQKGSGFREAVDWRTVTLKTNKAFPISPLSAFGRGINSSNKELVPTDLWSGYGFSSSLPAGLFRLGRMGGDLPVEGPWRKGGRPIMGRGTDNGQQQNGEENSWRRRGTPHEVPFGCSVDQSAVTFSPPLPFCSPNPCGSAPFVVLHETAEECKMEKAAGKATEKVVEAEEREQNGKKEEAEVGNSTAPVHPRVAALQMAEQQRKRFAISAVGPSDCFSRTHSTDGDNCTMEATLDRQGRWESERATLMGGAPSQNWDICKATEPAFVLARLGLAEHIAFFREQEIDMQAFLLLDEKCLESLGVATIGARRKILHAILKLRDSARCYGMYSL